MAENKKVAILVATFFNFWVVGPLGIELIL
jgi:hypothetical protein